VTARASQSILERLKSLHPKRIDLSLGRMERLLERLGHPERKLAPIIHVAGTNGKGSTTAYLKAMLEAAGFAVHVYTSPHLVHFNERIALAAPGGAAPIGETELADLLTECEATNGPEPITYFEITTACAFLAFSRHPADFVLLEVGLGGRLDATNVIPDPALTLITPVSVDHVQFLGGELRGIAAEKAGILKTGVPGVIAAQPGDAMAAIDARATQIGAPLINAGTGWRVETDGGEGIVVNAGERRVSLPAPALPGLHQIANAGLAAAALMSLLGIDISDEALAAGLRGAVWPGRLQDLSRSGLALTLPPGSELWLDGGHNTASGVALAETLGQWAAAEGKGKPLYLISGMMNVKDVTGFYTAFKSLSPSIIAVAIPDEVNTLSAAEVRSQIAGAGMSATEAPDVVSALAAIGREHPDTPVRVLICGSLYLAGHVLAELEGLEKQGGELA